MKRRQRQMLLISIVLVVGLCLILGTLLYLKSENKFLKYKDPYGQFTIKYPAEWEAMQDYGGAAVVFASPQENALDADRENVNIVIQDLSANPMTLDQYTELAIKQINLVLAN